VIRTALERLEEAGIAFALRGEQPVDDPPPGGDVDIVLSARDAPAAGRVLEAAGFRRFAAAGRYDHHFYLAFDAPRGRWLKLDLNLAPDLDRVDTARYRTRPASRLRAALPAAPRRLGPVVALIGPDGAGKGSIIAQLNAEIPVATTVMYMGSGQGGAPARNAWARAAVARAPADLRAAQYQARRVVRAALRAWAAHARAWRGDIVLCDRHPLEAVAIESDGGGLRGLLGRLVPWPDEIVLLDAPGEVLYARKGEHSPERLERWRRAYRDVLVPRGATVVPTTGELDASVAAASSIVWRGLKARRRW
jgi:thymidylate kinase